MIKCNIFSHFYFLIKVNKLLNKTEELNYESHLFNKIGESEKYLSVTYLKKLKKSIYI